jgi:hypothetical protein
VAGRATVSHRRHQEKNVTKLCTTLLLCCATTGIGLSPALAQPPIAANSPAPANAALLPPYDSAFDSYRPFREEATNRWRELNEEVGRIGGHAGVLKAGPAQPAANATSPAAAPSPSPRPTTEHGRHGKH